MQHLARNRKRVIILAVMGALLFAALNQTIIGTITPYIISDLGALENVSWIFTTFMLASTVATALAGRLSDLYGRKALILAGLIFLLVGCMLCGFSRSFLFFILFRAVQGLGVGIIIAMSFTVVGDLFVPRERGRWLGIVTSVYGIASVGGPVLGGYMADHADWRIVFWSFLPLGMAALIFVWLALPSSIPSGRRRIDYIGALWLTLSIVLLLLTFSLAGVHFAWTSPFSFGLLGAALLCLSLFVRAERTAAHPILPLILFQNSTFLKASLIGLTSSVCMFGTIMYAPLFFQGVLGTSAVVSGALIMPLTLCLVMANVVSGWLVSRTGQYKKLALAGLLIMTAGMGCLSTMGVGTSESTSFVYIAVFGIGLGIVLSVSTIVSQNAVDDGMMGGATGAFQLFRQFGATIGLAAMGMILQHRLPDASSDVSATIHSDIESLSYALQGVFHIGLIASVLALFIGLFIIEVPFRSTENRRNV